MTKKILLIEDDTVVRENTAELLELSGYEVIAVANGKMGVTTAKNSLPNLIICDIMMPELDGYGVLEQLALEPATRNIPFVFLSAKTEHKDIRKGMDLGADDYLTKPFDEQELISAIESRLAKSSIQKESLDETDNGLQTLNDLKNYFDDNGIEMNFHKGEQIFSENSHPNYVYLVSKGNVKCYKNEESGKELTTTLYKEDDLFGYIAVLHDTPRQLNAIALNDCSLMALPKETFRELLATNYKLVFEIINLLADNLEETRDQLLQMAYGSVRKKTASTILQFAEKLGGRRQDSIKISRNDLASVAGIATESLIRTLSALQKEGLIDIDGRNIKILDLEKLTKVT